MSPEFHVDICSPPDREKLVAHVMYGNEQVAEINQESVELQIELYANRSGEPWTFSYGAFLYALERARERLVGTQCDNR